MISWFLALSLSKKYILGGASVFLITSAIGWTLLSQVFGCTASLHCSGMTLRHYAIVPEFLVLVSSTSIGVILAGIGLSIKERWFQ